MNVGPIVGFVVGPGVDLPGKYVGSNVGEPVGTKLGAVEGTGVVMPGRKVGSNDG